MTEKDEQRQRELAAALEAAMTDEIPITPPADAPREVRLLGKKIFAMDPAFNQLLAVAPHLRHPLVHDRFFFTFPLALWNQLFATIGAERFDPELAVVEGALAENCDRAGTVGVWRGEWISNDLLRRYSGRPFSASAARRAGWNVSQQELDRIVQIADSRLEPINRVARGYAGWLLANRQFLDEHDELLERWTDLVRRWGLKHLGVLLPGGMLLAGQDPTVDPRWPEYKATMEAFFARWRLQALPAPYLPVPLRPLLAGTFPVSVIPQVNRAGGTFVLPDTFPIGTRDALREMLAEAVQRPEETPHLCEWLELVSTDNPGKKPIVRFSQLFELQHYWRILHHRHAKAIRRKLGVVKEVLASFLGVSDGTVHRNLMFLTKRLGKGWADRGAGSIFGPF